MYDQILVIKIFIFELNRAIEWEFTQTSQFFLKRIQSRTFSMFSVKIHSWKRQINFLLYKQIREGGVWSLIN